MDSPRRGRRPWRLIALILSLAALASACGASDGGIEAADPASDGGEAAADGEAPADSEAPASGEAPADTEAPANTEAPVDGSDTGPVLDPSILSGEAEILDGGSFDLATVANKDLVVWFWAPW